MSEPGLTTPVQPVQGGGSRGRGAIAVALVLLGGVGLLAWQPWVVAPVTPPIVLASAEPSVSPSEDGGQLDAGLLGGPTTGAWTGRVAADWSIVAFLRFDPVSRDPLRLLQRQVAVFIGPVRESTGGPDAVCDAPGTTDRPAAASLPTGGVRFLGIAYPADRTIYVDRVVRIGSDLHAIPVELRRIPGVGAVAVGPPTAGPAGASLSPSPGASAALGTDPVKMFGLAGGGPWPDGVYRFDVFTRDGPPAQMYACIRP